MSEASRICPLCEANTEELVCEECNVPSVEISMLDAEEETLTDGMMVAGRYKIVKVLGRGAMGSVYEAIQLSMDRKVAIKTLQKKLLNEYRLVQRFYREARAASQLDHPNIIKTFDFGIDPESKVPFIVMEYLDGFELTDLIDERQRLPEEETCIILGQVAAGLVEAHDKGVIHRDLKPANIRVRILSDGDIQAKVLDFGIAKVLHGPGTDESSLTGTGMTVGTPPYMSPEQILGEMVDARADLYSLGCILHECLVGELPFWADDRLAVLTQHLTGVRPALPAELVDGKAPSDGLVMLHQVLLSRKRDDRPVNAKVVAQIFKRLAIGKKVDVSARLTDELAKTAISESADVATDRNAALLASGSRDQLSTSVAERVSEVVVIASADTVAAISTDEAQAIAGDPLLTAPFMDSGASDGDGLGPKRIGRFRARDAYLGIGGLIAVGIAATVFAATVGGGDPEEEPRIDATTQTPERVKPMGDSVARVTPEARIAPTLSDRGLARVRLESGPIGAIVKSGSTILGKTPLEIPFADGTSERLLSVSASGYATQEIVLKRDMSSPHLVNLIKLAKKKKPKTAKAGKKTKKGLETLVGEAIDKGRVTDTLLPDADGGDLKPSEDGGETTGTKPAFLKVRKFIEKKARTFKKRAETFKKRAEAFKKKLDTTRKKLEKKKPLMDMW